MPLGHNHISTGIFGADCASSRARRMHQYGASSMDLLNPGRRVTPEERNDAHAFFQGDGESLGRIPGEHEIDPKRFISQGFGLLDQVACLVGRAPGQGEHPESAGVADCGR